VSRLAAQAGRCAIALVAVVLIGSCTSEPIDASPNPGPATGPTGGAPIDGLPLRVMEFNVEYGGEGVDFDAVPEAIEAAGADVVAIEEAYANIPEIARALGWAHYDERTQVLSRYPLLTPPEDASFTYVEVAPGEVVAVGNVHLPSTGYGPFRVRDGASAEDVAELERRRRLPALVPTLEALAALARSGVPVVLAGDFNAPSHLDWTEDAVGAREHVRFAMRWPVSVAVEEAGFVDTYRAANPDPVADPGLTWPANRPLVPGYNPARAGAPADRIDFVYTAGPATAIESLVVGEEDADGVDVAVSPWPSDHRAVVSTLAVTPSPAPTLVSADERLVRRGRPVHLRVHATRPVSVAIVPAGREGVGGAVEEIEVEPATGTQVVAAETEEWPAGAYLAVLLDDAGDELGSTTFWIRPERGRPQVRTSARLFRVGEPIGVDWRYAPGNRFDWIGVYRRGADPNRASYLLWAYTEAAIQGSLVLDRTSSGPWPLPAGQYSIYLLADDSYEEIAATSFIVR
jgi:hypothetical protein